MNLEAKTNSIRYLVTSQGTRTHIVIPIKDYERLIEDIYDNAVSDSRANEGTISLEESKQSLRIKRVDTLIQKC